MVWVPLCPVPLALKEALEKEVQSMLSLGIIEDSTSPWQSPPVLIPKPDGFLRFCIDFCCLNETTVFDDYPMPRIDNILDRIRGAQVLSTLDLMKGYWQVPVSPEENPKQQWQPPQAYINSP